MDVIVDILKQKIGLNPGSIGESSIRRAVTYCMSIHNINTFGVYSALLQNSDTELKRLIEEIVVRETWFFRNPTQFKELETYVVQNLLPGRSADCPIRILSVPCASGEEPYSIAITLREAGVPAHMYHIDAMDISQRSLNTALSACYSRNSFRDGDRRLINDYFIKRDNNYQLVGLIKNRVNFMLGNVLTETLNQKHYDLIFCRNLLIYFDESDQRTVLEKLHRCLTDKGLLFVGHAEAALVSNKIFKQLPSYHCFAFRKISQTDCAQISTTDLGMEPYSDDPSQWAEIINRLSVAKSGRNNVIKKKLNKSAYRTLLPAEKLVEQGRYIEATGLCLEYLQHTPTSAQANYLLGLIKKFQGEDRLAVKILKKAIYLDPNHEPALSLSLLLAQKRGDEDAIKAYSRRLERVKNRNRSS